MKKGFFHKLSDVSRLHHRAAFSDLAKHTHPTETAFLKLARARFSCRGFTEKEISDEALASILEAARLAPSATNKQPVHVWVVRTPEGLAKIDAATQYRYGAPLVLMVGCKPEEAWVRKYDGKNGAETDAAIVGTHIMMEASALHLGNVWVGSFDPAKLAEAFPETAGWEITALFPIGHPAAHPSPRHNERKPMEEFASEI